MLCSSSNILSSESSECVISSGLEVGSIKRLSAPLVSPFDPHPLISHSEVQSSSQPAILNSSAFRRSTVSFGLLINDEEKAARKAQEEKLREWSSLGVVLVDILEESNSATELLRFLDIWLIVFMEQDPVSAPRASASEIELDAVIGGGRLVDPSCFTSSLEFVSASLGFRELDSSRDFLRCLWSVKLIGARTDASTVLKCTDRKMENSGAPRDSPWLDRVTSVALK
ncbi:hypothetical protein F2Q69_00030425 [Brassica cretica]|uniref:Uncharacterized protein n=1 Tax=Brassica cretica TaxID=69181 RepID=A0A8S9S8Z7_BRACR|nr:hypothetical protein F2Q69_00030425 [Brassica cretica]